MAAASFGVRAIRLAAAATLAVGTTTVVASAAESSAVCVSSAITSAPHGWHRISAPTFTDGGPMETYAVARTNARRIYATDGVQVERSTDGGCHWASAFVVPETPTSTMPFSRSTASVTSIVTTSSQRVYLVVRDASSHPHVLISDDAGASWRNSDNGLVDSSVGYPPPQLAPAARPGTLYLLTYGADGISGSASTDTVYTSTDDGKSWSARPLAPAGLLNTDVPPSFNYLAVDPGNASQLWAATSNGLWRSDDAGANWQSAGIDGADTMSLVTAAKDVTGKQRVLTFESYRKLGYLSANAGGDWTAFDTPAEVDSVATGADALDASIAANGKVYQLGSNSLEWQLLSAGLPPLAHVTATSLHHSTIFACSCGETSPAIWEHASLVGTGVIDDDASIRHSPPPAKTPSQCMPKAPTAPKSPDWGDPQVSPARSQVVLTPGQKRTVHYVLHQPPEEMDVFLVTTTGPRSEFSHCPFKFGALEMMRALVRERNLRVGLGDYGDYTSYNDPTGDLPVHLFPGNQSQGTDYVYKLESRVGVVDQQLLNKLAAQDTYFDGTGPSGDQANLEVLYQAATGVGQTVGPQARPTYHIRSGLQAGFDDFFTYKVILHVAGAHFNTPGRATGYPGPEFAPVERTLSQHGIKQVGIWINNEKNKQSTSGDQYDGRLDLVAVARATGTVSPVTTRCDGKHGGVRAGDPLVCVYQATDESQDSNWQSHDPAMGLEMRHLLEAMRDPKSIRIAVLDGRSAVSRVTPSSFATLDMLRAHQFGFDVTYRCGAHETDDTKTVRLAAIVGGQQLATATTKVVCAVPAPPALHPQAAPPLVPPPPPAPAPNAPVNIAPNPAPQPAQVPQAQPQPGTHPVAAAQMQEQPQLALQRASHELQADQAMSALPPGEPPTFAADPRRLAAYVGVFLLVCSAGLARRVSVARSSIRRR
jgi:hypothetical protein